MGDQEYPQLKRPDDGEFCVKKGTKGISLTATNQHVVPYNEYLLYKYRSHINVEVVSSLAVVKYLFKYLFKGLDRALIERYSEGIYRGLVFPITFVNRVSICVFCREKGQIDVMGHIIIPNDRRIKERLKKQGEIEVHSN